MKRGPALKTAAKVDPVARALAAWGPTPPKEVMALAEACAAETARIVARKIGYSDATISYVLSNRYTGVLPRVFAAIRGALMGETVICPELDEIGRDRCLAEQKKPFSPTNSTRARLFYACKTCSHRKDASHDA